MKFIIKDLQCISYYQYISKNKRFITKRGKDYKKKFLEQINKQMLENNYKMIESENLKVKCHFIFLNRRCNDIENALKVPLDLLEGIAYKNDRWINELSLTKEMIIKPLISSYNLTIEITDLEEKYIIVEKVEEEKIVEKIVEEKVEEK